MRIAITREVSPAIERCELTHLARAPIDVSLARQQHAAYERTLADAGCEVQRLEGDGAAPDCVFIEDTAVVFDDVAVVSRPGAESRRRETPPVADALACYRPLRRIEAPGTLDGGDVLVMERTVYVGGSHRTNASGIEQLRQIAEPLGYSVIEVAVSRCLHLKSAVTAVAERAVLLQSGWVARTAFADVEVVETHPDEPFAANALRVGDRVIYPGSFPRTRRRLEERGLQVVVVDVGEFAKAEGGVTCCSLILTV